MTFFAIRMVFNYLVTLISTFLLCKYLQRLFVKTPIDNVPGPAPKSFWTGSFEELFGDNPWGFHKKIAEKYGGVIKIKAPLGKNMLYVYDPKALYQIIIKEQNIFEETTPFIEGNKVLLGHGLLGSVGDQHRKQRKMLNPVFSAAHIRDMTPVFYEVGYKLRDAFYKKVKEGRQEVDVISWLGRTSLEIIGQSGIGYSFDDLTEDQPPHEYAKMFKELIPTASHFLFFRDFFLPTIVKITSPKFQRFIVNTLPGKRIHKLKKIVDYIYNTSVMIYESKKKIIAEGGDIAVSHIGQGKDLMSILIKASMNSSIENRLSEEELLGQISTLTSAATDTTSLALSRILSLLAEHSDVQEQLRQEIIDAKGNREGDLSYDQLDALPYMDAVCRESLRLYPPASIVARNTAQDTVIPLFRPIVGLDGKELHELAVPKGTDVVVSILACNRNADVWGPDVYEWKPERWLKPLPSTVAEAHVPGVYSNLMTFLGGGRSCIGFKFAMLEMKVILAILIESFRFSLTTKEISWRMTMLASPRISDSDGNLVEGLPLLMERVDRSSS